MFTFSAHDAGAKRKQDSRVKIGLCIGSGSSYENLVSPGLATAGTGIGAEFQVNTYTTGSQVFPSVAQDSEGNFIVVWEGAGSSGSESGNSS